MARRESLVLDMDISAKARGRSINPAKLGIKGRMGARGCVPRVDTVDRSQGDFTGNFVRDLNGDLERT